MQPTFVPVNQQLDSIVPSIQWMCSILAAISFLFLLLLCGNTMEAYGEEEKKNEKSVSEQMCVCVRMQWKRRQYNGKTRKIDLLNEMQQKAPWIHLRIWRQKQYRQWARTQEMNMHKMLLFSLHFGFFQLSSFALHCFSFSKWYLVPFIFVFVCILECAITCIIM